jgi:hypothetical protein
MPAMPVAIRTPGTGGGLAAVSKLHAIDWEARNAREKVKKGKTPNQKCCTFLLFHLLHS